MVRQVKQVGDHAGLTSAELGGVSAHPDAQPQPANARQQSGARYTLYVITSL